MSKFLEAFNNRKRGINQKTIQKNEKKLLNGLLKKAFLQAQDDQTAVFQYENQTYILETLERRNGFIRNGGVRPTTQLEQRVFESWREVHYFMSVIDSGAEMELFADVDAFSFPFAEIQGQYGSKSKAVKIKMQNLVDEWEQFRNNNPKIQAMIKSRHTDDGKI